MTILAIDVGHGHTKAFHETASGAVRSVVFPSYVMPSGDSMAGFSSRDVVTIDADGRKYRAGPGINSVVPPDIERNRDERYAESDNYLVLIRAAMYYLGVDDIETLVVGLPLSTFSAYREVLSSRLQRQHTIPSANGANRLINVRRVATMPQPMAALLTATEYRPSLMRARILTLDYGYHTLDVLVSHGETPHYERMGVVEGGVAAYIDQLQKEVAGAIHRQRPELRGEFRVSHSIYEDALRMPMREQFVELAPGRFYLPDHSGSAIARIEQDLQKAMAFIRNANDLTAIVLAGGGAPLLQRPIAAAFPAISNVLVLPDSQTAIARGYLRLARGTRS